MRSGPGRGSLQLVCDSVLTVASAVRLEDTLRGDVRPTLKSVDQAPQ